MRAERDVEPASGGETPRPVLTLERGSAGTRGPRRPPVPCTRPRATPVHPARDADGALDLRAAMLARWVEHRQVTSETAWPIDPSDPDGPTDADAPDAVAAPVTASDGPRLVSDDDEHRSSRLAPPGVR